MSNKKFITDVNGVHILRQGKKKVNKICKNCLSKTKVLKKYGDKKEEWYCQYHGTIIKEMYDSCENFR